jgi:hypothetical protein
MGRRRAMMGRRRRMMGRRTMIQYFFHLNFRFKTNLFKHFKTGN